MAVTAAIARMYEIVIEDRSARVRVAPISCLSLILIGRSPYSNNRMDRGGKEMFRGKK